MSTSFAYHIGRAPRVNSPAPTHSENKQQQPPCKQYEANNILSFRLFPLRAIHVQQVKTRRVVEQIEKQNSKGGDDNIQVVCPSPLIFGMSLECDTNNRTETSNLETREEDGGDGQGSCFVWDKFGDRHSEGDLDSTCKSQEYICTNQSVDILGRCTDDGAD